MLNNKANRVCVFCASSEEIPQVYKDEASKLGELLATKGIAINYGGGSSGLMGAISNGSLKHNGEVRGIIPEFMVEREWAHPGVSDMIITKTMAERKDLLIEDADCVICLAGGTGTFEELFETISKNKLEISNCPIFILNTNGFFIPFVNLINKMLTEGFLADKDTENIKVINSLDDLMSYLS